MTSTSANTSAKSAKSGSVCFIKENPTANRPTIELQLSNLIESVK